MFTKQFKALGMAVCAFALLVPMAAMASDGTGLIITGGSLTMTNPTVSNFEGVTLDGQATDTTADLDAFSVTDATGSGAGWHVTVQAGQFVGPNHSLATSSLTMSKPSVTANGTTSTAPSVTSGPYTIDVATPVQFTSAAVNTGMGEYDYGQTLLTLSLPANVFAETYTSTVTLDVNSAP
jgi:hypothetical protein